MQEFTRGAFCRNRKNHENLNISLEVSSLKIMCHTSPAKSMVFQELSYVPSGKQNSPPYFHLFRLNSICGKNGHAQNLCFIKGSPLRVEGRFKTDQKNLCFYKLKMTRAGRKGKTNGFLIVFFIVHTSAAKLLKNRC